MSPSSPAATRLVVGLQLINGLMFLGVGGALLLSRAPDAWAMVAGTVICLIGLGSLALGRHTHREVRRHDTVLKNGVVGRAEVLATKATSTRINKQPLLELTLRIELPCEPPYELTTPAVVPIDRIADLVGQQLDVHVDDYDHSYVILSGLHPR